MTEYKIHDLERLSGIKAHTIRIWEKRYGLIMPSRTPTNRRYYSSEQLIRLLNISTLLSNGFKISAVAALTDDEFTENIVRLHHQPASDAVCNAYISKLAEGMLSYNEQLIEDTFNSASRELGFFSTITNVVYPFLTKTGLLWRTERVLPIQEHFASCIIRRKMIAAIDTLPLPLNSEKTYVLFLPVNEWHETGLLLTNYLLRSRGYRTIYLGQSVPYEDIDVVVRDIQPDYIITFFTSPRPSFEISAELNDLAAKAQGATVYYAGDSSMFKDLDIKEKNVVHLNGINALLDHL